MVTTSVTPQILSSVPARESCNVFDKDMESFSNFSSGEANQSFRPQQDASNIITNDSTSLSKPSCDETALSIPDYCIVDNTPPQNRKKIQITFAHIGVWRDAKRLKGLGAGRADLAKYTHVIRVILPNDDQCNELLKLYRGKLLGKVVGT